MTDPTMPDDATLYGIVTDCKLAAETLKKDGTFLTGQGIYLAAADAITTLRAKVADLKAERDRQYDENVNRIAAEGQAIRERDEARAEVDRLRGMSAHAPDGWRLVPVEPSFEMQVRGRDAIIDAATDDDLDLSTDDAAACYRAMVAASTPQPKPCDNIAGQKPLCTGGAKDLYSEDLW